MKTTIVDLVIYWFGLYVDNGKENGKYYNVLGLFIYIHIYIYICWCYFGIMVQKMEATLVY